MVYSALCAICDNDPKSRELARVDSRRRHHGDSWPASLPADRRVRPIGVRRPAAAEAGRHRCLRPVTFGAKPTPAVRPDTVTRVVHRQARAVNRQTSGKLLCVIVAIL